MSSLRVPAAAAAFRCTAPHPLSRIVAAAIAGALIIAAAGCSPGPSPAPTPTPAFADEADAFAAAEKVYRAYNDALNARRQGDVTADPQQYLTGAALEGFINSQNTLETLKLRVEGDAAVKTFSGRSAELSSDDAKVVGLVCIDVSAVALLDEAGTNVTPPERGDIVAQLVTFVDNKGSLGISYESQEEAGGC